MANEICHIEILAQDMGQSREFYSGIFGWQMEPMLDDYVIFKPGKGTGGALTPMPEHSQPTLIYIHVADIDATLAAITAAGGKALSPKRQISPEIGWSALFTDPAGNKVGLFTPS